MDYLKKGKEPGEKTVKVPENPNVPAARKLAAPSNSYAPNHVTTRPSYTSNKKNEYASAYLGHSKGVIEDEKSQIPGVTPHDTTGPNVGATMHSQIASAAGASPNRMRHSEAKVSGNTVAHVTNIPKTESGPTPEQVDAAKVKLFTRGSRTHKQRPEGATNRNFSKGENRENNNRQS